ncbi:ABC transporter permease subunit [Phototrophicus methaneseepsis]|uniref:ABC transporter permease subunit n=1 Tax=Phototrophicus methaneseepsis TaxID=2710758 RepID=A0A7S8E5D6_9CHLR|nr:ABC transporter permease [Phototrophicus methaneseepsis]QPC80703.1 ABC transporter permease subunit [Phototrophicus methaneseepsis]
MRATWLIFRREMGQYLTSPMAYLIGAAFLLLTGITFNSDLLASISVKPLDPAAVPSLLASILILFSPLLTMRLLAEEEREGTMELLLTAPVTDSSIVIGKFLSAWAFYTILLLLTLIYQVIAISISFPDISHMLGSYLGIWIYGGATLAIGTLFSATTENQILAAFLSLTTLFILYYGDNISQLISDVRVADVLFNLTLRGHFMASFAIGVLRAEDLVYYAGIIAIALFVAIQVVSSRRWR